MNFSNHQRGAGITGWLIMIMIFGLFITVSAKLLPLYMNHRTISTVLDSLAAEKGMAGRSKARLISAINKKLKINQIRNFPIRESLRIESTDDGRNLILEYEERIPLISNIDLIASFKKEVLLKP